MNIYKFRVILDTEEDVFRDIEITTESSFLEFHESIKRAFDFEGEEMASFYMSNEFWERGQEIPLLDMGVVDEDDDSMTMAGITMENLIKSPSEKLLYVYDFLRMWCFYIELVAIKKAAPSTLYPRVTLIYGEAPAEDSKEMDLLDGLDFSEEPKKRESTGDPELDAYLDEDDEDEDDGFQSLDDLDEDLY